MLPHPYPFTRESKGTSSLLAPFRWLFCQESACACRGTRAIAGWIRFVITLLGIGPLTKRALHPAMMQASISGRNPCQTRCSSIKTESRRSSMLVALQTRLSQELQLQLTAPRLAVTHSRPDQRNRIITPRAASLGAGSRANPNS